MDSIVIELQRDALDRSVQVSDLLRKALAVAMKLDLTELQQWIESELRGYLDLDEVPGYRVTRGEVKGWNPYTARWMPLGFADPKLGEKFSRRKSGQAIAALEHLVEGKDAASSELHMPYPLAAQRELSKGFEFETQVSLIVQLSSIVSIIDTVRTIVLNWALDLEKRGIRGAGMSFSSQERDAAATSPQNVVNIWGGVSGSQIQQGNMTASIRIEVKVRAVLDGVKKAIEQIDLSSDDKAEVEAEIATIESELSSPEPKEGVIKASFAVIQRILEAAAGGATGAALIELGKFLAGG